MVFAFGLVGYKRGMTQVFVNGFVEPVTVVEFLDNVVTSVSFVKGNCFGLVQLSTGTTKKLSKSILGHINKANIVQSSGLWTFRFPCTETLCKLRVGDVLGLEFFVDITTVDVSGISIGKGFAGVIKRHHFKMQPATHGNSKSHRVPGSIGQCQSPGRVFKGKKMPGRLGGVQRTVKNLKVVEVNLIKRFLLIKGSVPGFENGILVVKQSFLTG